MLNKFRVTRWGYVNFLFLFSLLLVCVFFSDSNHPVRVELQHAVFDQFNKIHPRQSSGKVVIVDIDEASLDYVGQWPWPRNVMAELTKSLSDKGAKVIAFDGVFSEEDHTSPHYFLSHLPDDQIDIFSDVIKNSNDNLSNYDDMFAKEIKKSKIFVTAFTYGRKDRSNNKPHHKKRILARSDVKSVFLSNSSYFDAAAVNLPMFSKNAAGNGSFMARPDADGVLRRVGMIFTDKDQLYPSLSLEALRVAYLGRKGAARLAAVPKSKRAEIDTNYRILIGDKIVPIEEDGILYVHYRHFCNEQDYNNAALFCESKDYISAHKFLDPKYAQEAKQEVEGKIVLLGASAEGLKDLRSTPLRPFRPGVEVHANVVEQIIAGEYLLRPSITKGVEALFIFITGLLFIILSSFIGVIISSILFTLIIGVSSFGAYYVYVNYGLLVDPVYPSLSVSVIFVSSIILSYARAEVRRKQIRNAFGMYVAPAVMRDLEKNPDKLTLGGENRELTVLFSDIRRFTAISEGLSPEDLIDLINEFLTSMTDIVMHHGGTVDKYIGDAMMTFWNAPKDVENHERAACLAALQMDSALAPINKRIKKRAEEAGKEPILLMAGIGINTGLCAVGNMGSKQRFAYSALGDAVNLASRLEGQTKYYGVNILVGETTQSKASDLAMIELDLIQVVGREEAVRIYGLFGDDAMAKGTEFISWKSLHDEMLSYYRSQNFSMAYEMIEKCEQISGDYGASLYSMYKERIRMMKETPLPDDWDGVFIAEGK
ncbi:MAG: CHASE2 domain-containing protein [Alphaproteobacteria bacterium]